MQEDNILEYILEAGAGKGAMHSSFDEHVSEKLDREVAIATLSLIG